MRTSRPVRSTHRGARTSNWSSPNWDVRFSSATPVKCAQNLRSVSCTYTAQTVCETAAHTYRNRNRGRTPCRRRHFVRAPDDRTAVGGEEHTAAVECRAASQLCTCTSVQTGHTEVEALAACSQPHEFRQLPAASRHKNARVSATCKGSEAGVDTHTVQYFARREGKRCASHTSLILTRGMVTAKHTTCVPRATNSCNPSRATSNSHYWRLYQMATALLHGMECLKALQCAVNNAARPHYRADCSSVAFAAMSSRPRDRFLEN